MKMEYFQNEFLKPDPNFFLWYLIEDIEERKAEILILIRHSHLI
jgi:hypothetical protein